VADEIIILAAWLIEYVGGSSKIPPELLQFEMTTAKRVQENFGCVPG